MYFVKIYYLLLSVFKVFAKTIYIYIYILYIYNKSGIYRYRYRYIPTLFALNENIFKKHSFKVTVKTAGNYIKASNSMNIGLILEINM